MSGSSPRDGPDDGDGVEGDLRAVCLDDGGGSGADHLSSGGGVASKGRGAAGSVVKNLSLHQKEPVINLALYPFEKFVTGLQLRGEGQPLTSSLPVLA